MRRLTCSMCLLVGFLSVLVLPHYAKAANNIHITPASLQKTILEGERSSISFSISSSADKALSVRVSTTLALPEGQNQWTAALPESQFPKEKIDPKLLEALTSPKLSSASEQTDALIYLGVQADLSPAYAIADWKKRGEFVLQTLRTTAEVQQRLLPTLEALKTEAHLTSYTRYYIVNAVMLHNVDLAAVMEVSALDQVAYVEKSSLMALPEPAVEATASKPSLIPWNVAVTGAPEVWNSLNIRGAGVRVANIDTGVNGDHPSLRNSYLGNVVGDEYAWFDLHIMQPPVCSRPCDLSGHGSHTLGVMVGSEIAATEVITIGLAPQAQWMAARGCLNACNPADLIKAGEWLLAPYRGSIDNPQDFRPELRPNVINNSWGGGTGIFWYQGVIDSWRAAGILPVFSVGNYGPDEGSLTSPADNTGTVAVGAVEQDLTIARYSGRGPGTGPETRKPELVAPGTGIMSAWNSPDYIVYSGTSMATPHVSGCAGLGVSAGVDALDMGIFLAETATDDVSNNGYDYAYGYGTLNCLKAVMKGVGWTAPTVRELTIQAEESKSVTLTLFGDKAEPGVHTVTIKVEVLNEDQEVVETQTIPITLTVKEAKGLLYFPLVVDN